MEEKKSEIEIKSLYIKGEKFRKNLSEGHSIERFLETFLDEKEDFHVYTSGSTGKPKGIRIQKEYMETSAQKTLDFLGINKGDKALLCLPTDKIAGIMMLVRWFVGRLDLYPVEATARPLEKAEGEFDFAAMVPYQVSASLDQLHRIRKLIIGGASINPSLEEKLQSLPSKIYQTYGMTETISHVAMRRVNGQRRSQSYEAMPGVSFSLDSRSCLVINSPEIGVKSLVTNDVVELESPERFIWKGRYDNVVNSGGVKLHPELIEKKIGPLKVEYFLAGIPDKGLGEKLVMLVESEEEFGPEYFEEAFTALDIYEKPKEIIGVASFSKTPNGKIRRKETVKKFMGEQSSK